MFSIIIPSLNNLKYLKLCIYSLKKNSKYNHEIIVHVNLGEDGTIDYLKNEKWFHSNLGKLFSIDMYVDSDSDSDY